jgi:hypothetical protein
VKTVKGPKHSKVVAEMKAKKPRNPIGNLGHYAYKAGGIVKTNKPKKGY